MLSRDIASRHTCDIAEGDEANSCEKIEDIHSLRTHHLLIKLTAFACREATCSELADCRKPDAPR
jgi:hypothetical protein